MFICRIINGSCISVVTCSSDSLEPTAAAWCWLVHKILKSHVDIVSGGNCKIGVILIEYSMTVDLTLCDDVELESNEPGTQDHQIDAYNVLEATSLYSNMSWLGPTA